MVDLIAAFLAAIRVFFRSHADNSLEVTRLDRLFWAALRHLWPRWSDVLAIVKPETCV